MTSEKSSVNKNSASFDLKRAFMQFAVPSAVAFIYLLFEFVINNLRVINFVRGINAPVPKGINISLLVPITTGTGFICAFCGVLFALANCYIMTKASVNFHLSLPVNRETLFKNRFIAASCYIAAVLAVVIGIDLAINISVLGNAAFLFRMAVAVYLEALTYIMASFTIMTIAIFSCYTVIEGVFFGAALLALPTIITCTLNVMLDNLLLGYARRADFFNVFLFGETGAVEYGKASLLVVTAVVNPLLLGLVRLPDGSLSNIFRLAVTDVEAYDYSGTGEDWFKNIQGTTLPTFNYYIPIIVWAVLICLCAILAKKVFVNRKAEKTSIHGSNPLATHIFAVLFALGVFMIANYSAVELDEGRHNSQSAFGSIVELVLIFLVSEVIVTSICKRQLIFKNKKEYLVPAISALCIAVISACLVSGGFGYSSYAPKADEIEYAAVTNGTVADITGADIDHTFYYSYPSFEYGSYASLAVLESEEDINKLLEVKEELVEGYKYSDSNSANVNIIYLTKSGKTVVRNYKTTPSNAQKAAIKLIDTKDYKNTVSSVIQGKDQSELSKKAKMLGLEDNDFIKDEMLFNNNIGINDFVTKVFVEGNAYIEQFGRSKSVPIENTEELRSALAADLMNMSGEERYNPSETEACRITFSTTDKSLEGYEYDGEQFRTYIVYPTMKNTLSYLEKAGVELENDGYFEVEPELAYTATVKEFVEKKYGYLDYGFSGTMLFEGMQYEDEQYSDGVDTYEEFADINTFFPNKTEDKAEIERLMQNAKPLCMANEDDLVVAFHLVRPDGSKAYQFMLIK